MSIKKIVRNILTIDISESAASLYLEKIYVESRKIIDRECQIYVESRKIIDCEYQIKLQVKEETIET